MRRRFAAGDKFDYRNYMTIEPLENISLTSFIHVHLEYTTNGKRWKFLSPKEQITLLRGKLYSFRSVTEMGVSVGSFEIEGLFNLKGNCMSLVFGDDAKGKTSLSGYSGIFSYLFYHCLGLQEVDKEFLPATTLAPQCYNNMFAITGIKKAPDLPAEDLVRSCYNYMFFGCEVLAQITARFITTPSVYYTDSWVDGVNDKGTFIKNPEATWEVVGKHGVPSGWIVKFEDEGDEVALEFPITLVEGDNGKVGVDL